MKRLFKATLSLGLALGVLLSKLVELALLKLLQSGVTFAFSVSVPALARCLVSTP